MRDWALPLLRCPRCGGSLDHIPIAEPGADRVRSGLLVCGIEACGDWYPITRGVPRMLTGPLRDEISRFVGEEHERALAVLGRETDPHATADGLAPIKRATMQRFGFEWTEYSGFGWDDPVYRIDREERIFRRKSLLEPEDLRGKLVLDAGCGNGRYAHWAAAFGGRVIAVDLGDGVESAARNTCDLDQVQVVQADLFNPPFAPKTFDVVFSIGVLMHTGDEKAAVRSLAGVVKAGGSLSVHLYGRGNVVYEAVDRLLRSRTTKRSSGALLRFTRRAYRLRRWLERVGMADLVGRFVRLDPHPHCIFDWYAAPVATHHSYAEVEGWFDALGVRVVATNEPPTGARWKRMVGPLLRAPGTVTLRGVLES